MIEQVAGDVPELHGHRDHAAGGAHRDGQRLERHRLGRDGGFARRRPRPGLEILDRVGGGDSFASGLVYGLLDGPTLTAVEYGAAHGALAMTTPGDTSMATLPEVEHLLGGGSARVVR